MSPFISVIVRVYNAEEYIERCVHSIVAQTYPNIEIIIVDDGSSDHSWEVMHDISSNLTNIVLLHQDNQGSSAARNNGVRHSSGQYVMFCDSYDTVEPGWCEKLCDVIQRNPNSLPVCGFNSCNNKSKITETYSHSCDEQVLDKMNYWKLFVEGLLGWSWNTIYDRSILVNNNLCFDESICHGEDVIFNMDYLNIVGNAVAIDAVLYNYYHYDDNRSLASGYHPNDFDIHALMYNSRKQCIADCDYTDFQKYYWYIFTNELERTMKLNKQVGFWGKVYLNQKIISDLDFQEQLGQFGQSEMNEIAYWCLEKKFYLGFWLIQKISKSNELLCVGWENSKVSIIVPLYNAEEYIVRCVEQLIKQSYSDTEVIIVDDGSTDSSWEHLKLLKSEKVILIRQANSGPSAARNKGMKIAMGKYIMFCDSDDTVEENWVKCYVSKLKQFPNALIVGNINLVSEDGSSKEIATITKCSYEKDEYYHIFLLGLSGSVYNKIFRNDILQANGIVFDIAKRRGEDVCFNLEYIKYVDRFIVIKEALYNYFRYDSRETLTNRYHTDDFDMQRMLYYSRKNFISKADFLDFQRYYYDVLENELRRAVEIKTSVLPINRIIHIRHCIETIEFQELLEAYGKKAISRKAFWCLKNKQYILYYILLRFSKIKQKRDK